MTLRAIKKTVVLVALVALAGVPFFGTIVTAPSTQEERQGMFGEVVTNDAGVLTLTLKSGETTTVSVVDETELRVPDVEGPTWADIPVGARVALVAESRDGGLVATKLQVIPSQVRQRHLTLTVAQIPHLRLLGWLLWAYSRCGVSTGVLIGLCAASLRGLATVSHQLWSLSG